MWGFRNIRWWKRASMRTGGGPWGMAWGLKTDIWIWGGWGVLVRDWKFLYSGVGDRVGDWEFGDRYRGC